ncbi:hypothetical protein ACWDT6_30025 [Nocardia grenadensis]|uniref:hypothetical protein n=1 Tax=Embleya sp. NPDC005971 TaxID=3156724 RepID=UPI0033FD4864
MTPTRPGLARVLRGVRFAVWWLASWVVLLGAAIVLALRARWSITDIYTTTITLRLRLASLLIADAERHVTEDMTDIAVRPWFAWIPNPLPEGDEFV